MDKPTICLIFITGLFFFLASSRLILVLVDGETHENDIIYTISSH